MANDFRVRTGKTSFIQFGTEKEANEYRKAHGEYGVEAEPQGVDLETEQANQDAQADMTKSADAPAENKARSGPVEKKSR